MNFSMVLSVFECHGLNALHQEQKQCESNTSNIPKVSEGHVSLTWSSEILYVLPEEEKSVESQDSCLYLSVQCTSTSSGDAIHKSF